MSSESDDDKISSDISKLNSIKIDSKKSSIQEDSKESKHSSKTKGEKSSKETKTIKETKSIKVTKTVKETKNVKESKSKETKSKKESKSGEAEDIKETKVYVQNTLKRVVPLQHILFIDKKNVYKVKDDKDNIDRNKLDLAFKALQFQINKYDYNKKNRALREKEDEFIDNIYYFDKYHKQNKKGKRKGNNWKNNNYQNYKNQGNQIKITKIHHKIEEIVDYLYDNDLCPAVIFVFSIKKITEYAKMLSLKNLASKNESKEILRFYNQVVKSMPEEDQYIPQVQELTEILQSGIGVHHAGLLPIIKEAIEILYSRGLIKVLFATTSFSIGLNMPTRTVVFTDLYKYDDTSKNILSSSEYLQMCGRAGRRGIDPIGNVYILLTELTNKDEKEEVLGMLEGKGTNVVSKFRICYRTLLSFYSRNIKDMNEFLEKVF